MCIRDRSIEPTLNLKNFAGGFYTKSDMSGDIHKFTKLLADACEKKGVKFYYEAEITRVGHNKQQPIITFNKSNQLQKQNFDGIVVCAGVNSKFIANGLGDTVNIYPVKGYSITLLLNDKESEELLDLYDRQRRPIAVEYVQAHSIRNKKIMEEKDPKIRRQRQDEIRAVRDNAEKSFELMMQVSMINSINKSNATV